MTPEKDPERGGAQPGSQNTFRNSEYTACTHPQAALVRLNCGAGGTQYRKFCLTCWCPLSGAIPHVSAHAEEARTGIQAPLATLELIHAAQDCYARLERSGEAM